MRHDGAKKEVEYVDHLPSSLAAQEMRAGPSDSDCRIRVQTANARTYGSVKSILANNLDRRPAHQRSADDAPILHANIRGPRYYN
ncbi:hypothetical protein XH92_07955 [Bradyrhizobium sp. CCBAU 53421]|nr:hypothetical protein XH92_07955 [Bradyrhizobium sp. CCBAU 53421]